MTIPAAQSAPSCCWCGTRAASAESEYHHNLHTGVPVRPQHVGRCFSRRKASSALLGRGAAPVALWVRVHDQPHDGVFASASKSGTPDSYGSLFICWKFYTHGGLSGEEGNVTFRVVKVFQGV
jgi:hypothetical protein